MADDMEGFDDAMFAPSSGPTHSAMDEPHSKGTLKVKKLEYAIGLIWEGVGDPTTADKVARERASISNADFFCVRKASATQFGLGLSKLGHKANMPSLAAHIANNRLGQFLALFEHEGGYYILGVRHDGINSQLERFISDRHEAIELFEEYSGLAWDEKIAPESFAWADTIHLRIEDCVNGRPPVKLKEVNRRNGIMKIAAVVVLIAVAVVGYQYYQKLQADAEAAAQLQALADQAKENLPFGQKKQVVVVPPMPWEGMTAGVAMLNKCVTNILEFPLDVPGWNVTGFSCQNPNDPVAAAVVSRSAKLGAGGGPITWLEERVAAADFKPSLLPSNAGSSDTQSLQWMLFKPEEISDLKYKADQPTLKVYQIKKAMLSLMEQRMTPVNFGSTDATEFYRGVTFDFETKFDPREYLDILSHIPGVIMDEVAYGVDTKTWKIRGKAYEQLPLPVNAQRQK